MIAVFPLIIVTLCTPLGPQWSGDHLQPPPQRATNSYGFWVRDGLEYFLHASWTASEHGMRSGCERRSLELDN